MHKMLIVASSEFGTLVRSKAFVLTLILMPVIMGVATLLMRTAKDARDTTDRRFAYVDHSGIAGPVLQAGAEARNATAAANGVARFQPVEISAAGKSADELRIELSDRVRSQEFFAFVEIPRDIADPDSTNAIRYYSDHPSYGALPDWIRSTVTRAAFAERFRAASVDPSVVARLTRPVASSNLGLFEREASGAIKAGEEVDEFRAVGVPAVMMVLMFIVIMASSPQLLNSVIEEKLSRISEVLIGSVTPFELMMGKLLGCVAVSLLLAMVYIAGGLMMARTYGYADALTPAMTAWFLLFLLMAVLIFGSIFIAVGAACNDLKDSQNMMTPVMLFMMVPVFTWVAVLRAPDSTLSLALSLFPTTAPFLMLLRIALQPGPPLWQVLLSVGLTALATVAAVWAAGRIFRTGILMQGKSASLAEMVRWVKAG
ncbi:MAG TPA: ABC transporter permease [Vicinamibacterales bacterium]|nr:ABC transporter permease [Vicinamibacterales bacterium]